MTIRLVFLCLLACALCCAKTLAQGHHLTNGIVVGGVTEDGARFWGRLDGKDLLSIELATERDFSAPSEGSADSARIERNFAVLLTATGLQADTRYYYRAVIGGVPQSVGGSFRTFPQKGNAATFTFGFGSCQQSGSFLPSGTEAGNVFREVIKTDPRFFLQIGDWGYPDTTDNLPADSAFFAADFARVQATYLTKFDEDYPMDSLLRIAPVDYVYDDHDYMNNNASARTSSFTVATKPNEFGDDYVIREIANPPLARGHSLRGYRENMPTYPLANESRGIYHSFSCGNAEFFMLDLRSERSPNLEPFVKNTGTGKWEFHPAAGHSILGRDAAPGTGPSQLSWLLAGLQNSTATWKFIVSSVPFNRGYAEALSLSLALQDVTVSVPEFPAGTAFIGAAFEFADKWVGFPADADTLLSVISSHAIKNVIVLSGDSHTAALDDGTNAGLPEIMAGGLDITNSQVVKFLAAFGLNLWNKGGQGLTTQVFDNAFGKVTVFGEDSVRLALVDELGTVFASYTVTNAMTAVGLPPRSSAPVHFALEQNYPNPFNPTTVIRYQLPQKSNVVLTVTDLVGRYVATLEQGSREAGTHEVRFDAGDLASGVYFYRLRAGDFDAVRKMILVH